MAVAGARGPDSAADRARAGLLAIPGIRLVRTYDRSWLPTDALAALTVWALLVPQALAYAQLGGFDPVVGLYASASPGRRVANQPTRTSSRSSIAGTCGLLSSSGVPSTMSTTSIAMVVPVMATRRTVERPIGLGRAGERVAKMPWGRSSRNGVTVS